MSVLAWAKVKIMKRKARSTFGSRNRIDGKEEYIIKIPGFSGELRRTMSEEEALEWVEKTNKDAFIEAAEASKGGLHGYEAFCKFGEYKAGMMNIMARAAGRGFGTRKVKDKE